MQPVSVRDSRRRPRPVRSWQVRARALFMRQQAWIGGEIRARGHAAMFELESGHPARVLDVLDESCMPHATRSASDAADATALLWRLEVDGVDPGSRWSLLSDCWATHASPGYWPFLDFHAAIAFSAAGHTSRAHSLSDIGSEPATGPSHDARRHAVRASRGATLSPALIQSSRYLAEVRPSRTHRQPCATRLIWPDAPGSGTSSILPQRTEWGVAA
jgi:hypothetical protein